MRLPVCLILLALPLLSAAAPEHAAARALFEAQRYAEAEQAFAQAAARQPDDPVAHHYLGRLARLRQDLATAVEHLERAADLRPDDPAIQHDLGAACALHADTLGFTFRAAALARRGRKAMERAVALAPDVVLYHRGLLEFHRRAPRFVGGQRTLAYAAADAMRALDPFEGTVARAGLLLEDERGDEAIALWQAFLRTAPDHPAALYQLGLTSVLSGHATDAGVAALQRALELPPVPGPITEVQLQWRLGQLRARQGDRAGAATAWRRALALDPEQAAVRRELAQLEQNQ